MPDYKGVAVFTFFFQIMQHLARTYANLFGSGIDEADTANDTDIEVDSTAWLKVVDALAHGDRTKWEYFLKMPVIEFLNAVAFQKDKVKQRTELIEAMIKGKDVQAATLAICIYMASKDGI